MLITALWRLCNARLFTDHDLYRNLRPRRPGQAYSAQSTRQDHGDADTDVVRSVCDCGLPDGNPAARRPGPNTMSNSELFTADGHTACQVYGPAALMPDEYDRPGGDDTTFTSGAAFARKFCGPGSGERNVGNEVSLAGSAGNGKIHLKI